MAQQPGLPLEAILAEPEQHGGLLAPDQLIKTLYVCFAIGDPSAVSEQLVLAALRLSLSLGEGFLAA